MAKGTSSTASTPSQKKVQNLAPDVIQLIEQLDRHCLTPDGSYVSRSVHSDLQLAKEEMWRERTRYLEAIAVYSEAVAIVEEYHQSLSGLNVGNARDNLFSQPGLMSSPQVYESLEHRLVVAEAAQRLRLPLLSNDGDVHEEEIEKWSGLSNSSFDSSTTSFTTNSISSSIGHNNSISNKSGKLGVSPAIIPASSTDVTEAEVGGVPNKFLGITPSFLWQVQKEQKASITLDVTEYQRSLACEIKSRLEVKCEKLVDASAVVDSDSSISQIPSSRLPERIKLFIEEIEREEALLLEDLYSMDRKFAEHYNALEQILRVLIKFSRELKLQHQHQYDEMRKTWLCKRCQTMNAKLRVLEYLLLRDTYTKDSVPALHIIRKCLLEATEEASIGYNKAVTRLREYQGVDPHFDNIARQYHDIVKKLEGMQWTIHQVEKDLKPSLEHAGTSTFA